MQHRHRSMCRNWDVSSILVRSVDCICYRSFVACPPSFACQPVLWYKSTQQSFCCTGVAAPPFSDLLLLDVLQSQTEKMSARRPLGGSGQSLLLDWPGLQAQAHFISDILPEFSLVVRLRVITMQFSTDAIRWMSRGSEILRTSHHFVIAVSNPIPKAKAPTNIEET